MDTLPKIVLIGAGRIATHLGRRLKGKGLPIAQVISRTEHSTKDLAAQLQASWSIELADILPDADWIIIAVRDDVIGQVAAEIGPLAPGALATHTSGGTAGDVLAPHFERFGVFYPLQSFSTEHTPIWSKIPFCVDAIRAEDVLFLRKTAKTIGNLVYHVNDTQRTYLHVAAVFANNFANHCFAIAEKILDEKDLPFELLHPLMEETLAKALQDSPARMQTGPAVRGDQETIKKHMGLLEIHPEWQELYAKFSKSIHQGLGEHDQQEHG